MPVLNYARNADRTAPLLLMPPRIAHVLLMLLALALLSVRTAPAAEAPPRPNIIFILADDLGWADLGCYGHPHIKTPHLDQLAKSGTLFTQFYVNGSVCSPSRVSFMTGHYPARHRIHGHLATEKRNAARGMPNWLDTRAPLLPKLLKSAGYTTAHFGKWHLGNGAGAPPPDDYGFDAHRTVQSNGPGFEEEKDEYFRARSTDLFVDEAIKFIEDNQDTPFYVDLWTLVPHATLHPTDEQKQRYKRFSPGGVPYDGAGTIFYSAVTGLDTALGRLFQRLKELDLRDNTLILFSSDNGPEDIHIRNASHSGIGSPGPFRGRKRSLYEGGIRVPFLVSWPGYVPAGRIDDESVVSAVDFLPTLTTFAGATVPDDAQPDGENIADILLGTSRARSKPLLWEWRFNVAGYPIHHSPILAIRDGDWKLLLNPDGSRMELYAITEDTLEVDNQAAAHPDVVRRLSQTARNWQSELPSGPMDATAGQIHYNAPSVTGQR